MKVKELIEELQKYDGDLSVILVDTWIGRGDGNFKIEEYDGAFSVQEYGRKSALFIEVGECKEYRDPELEEFELEEEE